MLAKLFMNEVRLLRSDRSTNFLFIGKREGLDYSEWVAPLGGESELLGIPRGWIRAFMPDWSLLAQQEERRVRQNKKGEGGEAIQSVGFSIGIE